MYGISTSSLTGARPSICSHCLGDADGHGPLLLDNALRHRPPPICTTTVSRKLARCSKLSIALATETVILRVQCVRCYAGPKQQPHQQLCRMFLRVAFGPWSEPSLHSCGVCYMDSYLVYRVAYVHTCVGICVWICIYIYIYMYLFIQVHTHTCIYTEI